MSVSFREYRNRFVSGIFSSDFIFSNKSRSRNHWTNIFVCIELNYYTIGSWKKSAGMGGVVERQRQENER